MNAGEVVEQLFAACRSAGVDPGIVFEHFADADVRSYGEALERGWIDPADLPKWMASTAATIRDGRCLCRHCLAATKEVAS